jgi:hypothetical protein
MPRSTSTAVSTGLIGAGALVCALAGKPLLSDPELAVPLNILGINRSPYGEVFAMAMQEPIDTYFHHTVGTPAAGSPRNSAVHDDCGLDDCPEHGPASDAAGDQCRTRHPLRGLLDELESASAAHTNPKPRSEAQKRHIRRKVEDQLRFAYQLDPAHYGNYNSYHFFLVEPALGTRPELTPGAAKLADDTIRYCLQESHDPRPALTGEPPRHSTAQMRDVLALLDYCIARHFEVARVWEASGDKDLLSPMRLAEMEERLAFILRIRDSAEGTIVRLEQPGHQPQAAN